MRSVLKSQKVVNQTITIELTEEERFKLVSDLAATYRHLRDQKGTGSISSMMVPAVRTVVELLNDGHPPSEER